MHPTIEQVVEAVSGEIPVGSRPVARRLLEGVLDELGGVVLRLRAAGSMDEARRAERFASRIRLTLEEPAAAQRMQALTRGLRDAPDLESLFTRALDGAISLIGADFGNLQTPDEAAGGLVITAESGFSSEFLEYFAVVHPDDVSACGRAAGERAQTVVADVRTDAAFAPHRAIAAASGFRAVQSTPLVDFGGELRGVISTHFRGARHPSAGELRIMGWYADHIAAAAAHLGDPAQAGAAAAPAPTPDVLDAGAFTRDARSGLLLPARTSRRRSRDPHLPSAPRRVATQPRGSRGTHALHPGRVTARGRRAARQQALLADLGRRVLEGEPQALLDEAMTQVANVMELELSYIAGASGSARDHDPLADYATTATGPVTSGDLRTEDRFARSPLLAERDVRSAAAVVIPSRPGRVGVLIVAARKPHAFDAQDVTFLQGVANVLGCAVDRADADARLERARESERRRIARDLHDEALRELMDAVARATVAGSVATEPPDQKHWAEQTATLARVGRQVRGAIYDLSLDGHGDGGFADRLGQVVAVEDRHAAGCRVEFRGRDGLPAASLGRRGTAVLRIVREAIINARSHSGATHIRVDAGGSADGVLRLQVTDDGDWPERESVVRGGRGAGIQGMLERAAELQATLRIAGAPGGGTSVALELALGDPAAAGASGEGPPARRW